MAILFQFHPAYARADILATSRVKLNSFHIKKKKYFHTVYVKTKPWSEDLYRDIYSTCLCSVQSLSCVHFFLTPWTALLQASLSISNSWSLLKLMSVELVMPSNHLILCRPLQSFPASRFFPKSQFFTSSGQSIGASAAASVLPMIIQDWHPLGWTGCISLQSKGL